MSVTRSSLAASASGAESAGSTTLAGASAAVATMLSDLDDFSDAAVLGLVRESLDKKAMEQRATNLRNMVTELHKKPVSLPSRKWKTNERTARVVQLAALCSRAVYRKDPTQVVPELPDYAIKDRHWIEPTADGSGKAAALFEIVPTNQSSRRKILVVAVRGSAGTVDWLVNLNTELADCLDLLKLPKSHNKPLPKVHRGFAQCARTIAPGLLAQIKTVLNEDQEQDQEIEIVFTGHSAGGAVACLLFGHFLTAQVLDVPSAKPKLSCISFGCPPLFDADIDSLLIEHFPSSSFREGIMLAFLNDGDPIPRMDSAYATELARIWHRVGGSICPPASELPDFKPPKLHLNTLGQMVLLYDKQQDFTENDKEDQDQDEDTDDEEEKLMTCRLDRGDLEKQAWANVLAHRMNQYVEWTTRIGDGCFNGRLDWQDDEGGCCILN
ncbi:Alpha/Beta hydrolase protein [Colletotrichum phormii]|uniref:Alpha/Beta hydrolase protein n=1 Tax=Colletotrichum phormii TaxID=359342 RepID=A0AAJ0ECP4_9PEZI|nr:Alpha/Beta hydrolase protein [Colletotrichum phormii]KAK1634194.1 Alpha/Beta hydrolase protein [Colletotrichum phormii]